MKTSVTIGTLILICLLCVCGLGQQQPDAIPQISLPTLDGQTLRSADLKDNTVKVEQSEEARFRIGSYIKAHPELHEVIRRWGWVTLVLTPDEKLIARAIINAQRDGNPAPSLSELAKAVAIEELDVKRGLAMLAPYEILTKDARASGSGYSVVARYIKWEPRASISSSTT
ncbi:MAG: hypothetical protein ACREA9_12360 [Pyrinomonadaceae bacterium]